MASLLGGREAGSDIATAQAIHRPSDSAAISTSAAILVAQSGLEGSVAMDTTPSSALPLSLAPSVPVAGCDTTAVDLSHVLTGLQRTGDLSSVLHDQPNLVGELGVMATSDVTTDPESLRFQYPLDETVSFRTPAGKKTTPTVYREQDRFLPINNVSRVMRHAIPRTGKVSKDAKECMQECVSEFISFITSEAVDRCAQEKRKTITGDDLLVAMATLGFDNYIEPMRLYLQKIRDYSKNEKIAGGVVPSRALSSDATPTGPGSPSDMQSLESPESITAHYQPLQ